MKKKVAILMIMLLIGILMILAGIYIGNLEEKNVTKPGMVILGDKEFLYDKGIYNIGIDIFEDKLVVLNEKEATETEKNRLMLELWDLSKNKCMNKVYLDELSQKDGSFGVKFENEILVYDEWDRICKAYDLNLNYICERDYKLVEETISDLQKKSDNGELESNHFVVINNCACFINNDFQISLFENDTEKYYFEQYEKGEEKLDSLGNKLFLANEKEDKIEFYIKDYQNKEIINRTSIDLKYVEEYSRIISKSAVNDKYFCIPIYEDGYLKDIYYWNYNLEKINEPFEVEEIKKGDLEIKIQEIAKQMKEDWDINVYFNRVEEDDWSAKKYEKSNFIINQYLELKHIQEIYKLFPKEMFKEMLERKDRKEDSFTEFNIYLVGCFPEDSIAAYASNVNDKLYIVYGIDNYLSDEVIVHELMHNLEYRIWDYDKDFDKNWEAINPKKFEYNYDYEKVDFEKYKEYFKYNYGTRSLLEDHATIFEGIFVDGKNKIKGEWQEYEPVKKKIKLLCEALRKSYPSIQKLDKAIWEEYL